MVKRHNLTVRRARPAAPKTWQRAGESRTEKHPDRPALALLPAEHLDVRAWQIFANARLWSNLAFFLPMFGGFAGIGVVIWLERGWLLGGGIIGASIGWVTGLILDRLLLSHAIAWDQAARRHEQDARKQALLNAVRQARQNGEFKRWEQCAAEDDMDGKSAVGEGMK